MRFDYTGQPSRVLFGKGRSAEVAAEVERLGIKRALVISTADQSPICGKFAKMIGSRLGAVYPGAVMHTPMQVTESALQAAAQVQADGILAIGGGSSIGLAKAIAYRTDLPQVVVPTTYSGSEMTAILGQTENNLKTTLKSPKVLPETVIYYPELTVSLPPSVTGPSGMNAIAHAVEALYAEDANPITSMMAEEAIRALGASLPEVAANGENLEARATALYGSWLAGSCLGAVGMALHHKICHTLGGTFDLPHADIHCLMIPYSAAYNREAAQGAMERIAKALGAEDGPSALFTLMLKVGRTKSLAEFGLTAADLDRAADLAIQNPYYNPRLVTREGIRDMLQAAYECRQP